MRRRSDYTGVDDPVGPSRDEEDDHQGASPGSLRMAPIGNPGQDHIILSHLKAQRGRVAGMQTFPHQGERCWVGAATCSGQAYLYRPVMPPKITDEEGA